MGKKTGVLLVPLRVVDIELGVSDIQIATEDDGVRDTRMVFAQS